MTNIPLYTLPPASRAERHRVIVGVALTLVASYLVGASAAASRLAYTLGYPPSFGVPLHTSSATPVFRAAALGVVALSLTALLVQRRWGYLPLAAVLSLGLVFLTSYSLYPPSSLWNARKALSPHAEFAPQLHDATLWGLAFGSLLPLALLPALVRRLQELSATGDIHGSARFATPAEILEANFIFDDPKAEYSQSHGLPLGNLKVRGRDRLVRAAGDVHVIALAPPGSGKTTAWVIPTAQDWKGNLFVLDVKREIYQATAGHRSACGSQILICDPSRDRPDLARYNPLLAVRPYPEGAADIVELAQLLSPVPEKGGEPFWAVSAQTLLAGLITHILYTHRSKTLNTCYRSLCDPERPLDDLFAEMLETEHDPSGVHGWTHHPVVETAARTFIDMTAQTRSGVVANALAALQPYSDPILAAATATSDFAPSDLIENRDRPVTLYLTIDPNSLTRLSNHIRIVISQITSALTRELLDAQHRRPLLLLLDEFATFGRMPVVEKALAYLRGYGVQAWIVVQHQGQLTAAYGPSEGISPNCQVHLAFAPSHLDTAKGLSERAGSRTVSYARASVSSRGGSGMFGNTSSSDADTKRPLLDPAEIMRLSREYALVLRTSCRPILLQPVPFFKDPARIAAAALPAPPSESTNPDFRHWTDLPVRERPAKGRRERRAAQSQGRALLPQEPLL